MCTMSDLNVAVHKEFLLNMCARRNNDPAQRFMAGPRTSSVNDLLLEK